MTLLLPESTGSSKRHNSRALEPKRWPIGAAGLLFYLAVVAAVITAVTWPLIGQPDQSLVLAVTVLIIACPHVLGLAIPL
ncbi:hypothetical protein, partial [Schaalia turicensis]|uniref:hypothetical protein n=1 Tax=Schaalia turicensis TaxID=131111 RepID=UPI0034A58BE3